MLHLQYLTESIQVSSIEFSLVEKDVLFGLKEGNQVLTEMNKEMNLETVEKLMEETAEGIAYQKVRQDNRSAQPLSSPLTRVLSVGS